MEQQLRASTNPTVEHTSRAAIIVRKADLEHTVSEIEELTSLLVGGFIGVNEAAGELRRIRRLLINLNNEKTGTAAL